MKSTFFNEEETKKKLCDFITSSPKLSMGEYCKKFEDSFSQYQGRKYSVLFNSGSSANFALIQALINLKKINRNENVGFSSLTWATNVSPLIGLGLEPIPIEIDLAHLNVTSENLRSTLRDKNLKALFLTNLLGFCGDIDEIKNICEKNDIVLIEDSCESLGSEFKGKKTGSFGLASTFSFFVGHHISTIEGGMVSTDDSELHEMLKMVRSHGWSRDLNENKKNEFKQKHNISDFFDRYVFYEVGYNLRPTEITGFLGVEQLKYVNEIHRRRSDNFKSYDSISKKNEDIINLDVSHMDFVSNFAYPVFFKDSEKFEKYKNAFLETVEIRPLVGGSIVEQPFFKKFSNISYDCPNAKKAHEFGFYIPNNPELTEQEISHVQALLAGNVSADNNRI